MGVFSNPLWGMTDREIYEMITLMTPDEKAGQMLMFSPLSIRPVSPVTEQYLPSSPLLHQLMTPTSTSAPETSVDIPQSGIISQVTLWKSANQVKIRREHP